MSLNLHIASNYKRLFLRLFIGLCAVMQLSCKNLFTNFASKTDDVSLLYSARKYMRDGDYTSAILKCGDMSASFLAESEVALVCASAYAGRCGFTMLGMVSDIDTYITSTPPEMLFHWFLTQISTTAQNVSDCGSALQLMNATGAAATRSDDENGFVTLLSLYAISAVLNETGDTDENNLLDGGYNACALNGANSQAVGFAFWELYDSLTALQTNPYYSSFYTAIDGLCTILNGLGKNLCNSTTPLALTNSELDGARSLLKEGAAVGIDQCGGNADLTTCNCP